VFLLVPLKNTLARLSIATNPDINSDCVPALLILRQLTFVSILDTCIDMTGLRKLALAACEGHYAAIDIEIPCDCDTYIESRFVQTIALDTVDLFPYRPGEDVPGRPTTALDHRSKPLLLSDDNCTALQSYCAREHKSDNHRYRDPPRNGRATQGYPDSKGDRSGGCSDAPWLKSTRTHDHQTNK
jgi:hypothetical protein